MKKSFSTGEIITNKDQKEVFSREAVIVSAVRTPLGCFNGMLSGIGATKPGALVIDEAVKRAGIGKETVNEVIMGQVLPCGYGQNPAKQAAVLANMPWEMESITKCAVLVLKPSCLQHRRARREMTMWLWLEAWKT
jgi:hypothetical protein